MAEEIKDIDVDLFDLNASIEEIEKLLSGIDDSEKDSARIHNLLHPEGHQGSETFGGKSTQGLQLPASVRQCSL